METASVEKDALKQALKEALAETLQEHRGFIQEIFAEVLEDFALTEAIREGEATRPVSREKVFERLQGRP